MQIHNAMIADAPMAHRLWILGCGSITNITLGPTARMLGLAHQSILAGITPVLALEDAQPGFIEGIEVLHLTPATLSLINSFDMIVCSYSLHPKTLLALCALNIPFHLDMYGVNAIEHIELPHRGISPRRIFQSRRRMRRRYRMLIERAEKIYLSNTEQLTFLGGLLFADGNAHSCQLASRLPERVMFLPMGAGSRSTNVTPNPYPDSFNGRPIFLWGGGIWNWFDLETLIRAFAILKERNSAAVLYFLCGTNITTSSDQDEPVQKAHELARKYGLLKNHVDFHDGGVLRSDLPRFLEHCTAGIMTNPDRLESIASWRTRLLDLPAYGKPTITSGFDPLSAELASAGAGVMLPGGDPQALADAIEHICQNPDLLNEMGRQAIEWARTNTWDSLFASWREQISQRGSSTASIKPVSWWDIACYIAGI